MQIVAQTVQIGPMFAGNTGPSIEFILLWDAGGYVDLTGAVVSCNVRRWDPRKKVPIGQLITSGDCEITVEDRGTSIFEWESASPVATIPIDPGWYVAQVRAEFSDGKVQESQRVVFEVLPTSEV